MGGRKSKIERGGYRAREREHDKWTYRQKKKRREIEQRVTVSHSASTSVA